MQTFGRGECIAIGVDGLATHAVRAQVVVDLVASPLALALSLGRRLVERYGGRRVYLLSLTLSVVSGIGPAVVKLLQAITLPRVVLAMAVSGVTTAGYAVSLTGGVRLLWHECALRRISVGRVRLGARHLAPRSDIR
jgi:hypothetical protein